MRQRTLLAMLQQIGFAVLFLVGVATIYDYRAYACGPDWTNLGSPALSIIQNVVISSLDPSTFIGGTPRNVQDPSSGGIYRHSVDDTAWVYSGLVYHGINDLKRFDFNPQSLFAATSEGLYRSDDDGVTWDLITRTGSGGFQDQVSILISPSDSTKWLLGSFWLGSRGLYISHDSGEFWELVETSAPTNDLTYSSLSDSLVYAAGRQFKRYNIQTDSVETLFSFWGQTVMSVEVHATQPWIYFATEDTVGRYDEFTGEFVFVPIPGTAFSQEIVFWPPDSLMLGTEDDIYVMDENLENWRSISGGRGRGTPLLCSQYLQAVNYGVNFHCRDLLASSAREQTSVFDMGLKAYPNPTNSSLTLVSDHSGFVSVYNLMGQEVLNTYLESRTPKTIELDRASSGTYFVAQRHGLRTPKPVVHVPITVIK